MRSDGRLVGVIIAVLAPLTLGASAGLAQTLVTREEALALAYPEATCTAERVFLTDDQRQRAATLSGLRVESALVARYVARHDDRVIGRAYVDTHVVRTKRESLLVALDADGRLRRVEVTAFLEPPEYQAPETWLNQFRDRDLSDDLRVQRAIRPLAGATLTAQATSDAVRRVMAIDRVLQSGASRQEGR